MNVSSYLDRIGISELKTPDLEFLGHLQEKHLLSVPFENLDSHREGHKIILDHEKLYEKVVVHNRGGFCYELNGLFCWLLRELGYKVEMLQAEVYSEKKSEWGPPFDHLTLLVHQEESFLVDVGFGISSRNLLKMPDGQSEDVGGKFRVVDADGFFFMQQLIDGEWRSQHRFNTTAHEFSEYVEMCNYHQTSPESHFMKGRICTMAKDWGRVTLTGKSLVITKGATKTNINFSSEREFDKHLEEQFGIVLD